MKAIEIGNWGGGVIIRITSGIFPSNAYVCEADVPGGCILIDPGLDWQAIDNCMKDRGLSPHQIYCTHGHFDHAGSASFFQTKYKSEVFLHKNDERTLKSSNFLLMILGVSQRIDLPKATFVGDGFHGDISKHAITFLPAPGHTPGSCVLGLGNAWFTGDTLYSRGVGLSKMPGEDADILKKSILNLWGGLTANRYIYPGHGDFSDGMSIRANNTLLLDFLGIDRALDV